MGLVEADSIRLEATLKNLETLQVQHDDAQDQLSTGIGLLKKAGILDEEGQYDEAVAGNIGGQRERYEAQIEDLQSALSAAAEEIKQ